MAPKKRAKKRRAYGSGSTYEYPKGSGKWFAAERIDGKLTVRRANSEQAANQKLTELQELKRNRVDVEKGSQTYQSWLQTFYNEKLRLTKPSPRTAEFNLSLIQRYISPRMGGSKLLDIRPTDIQEFLEGVYAEIQEVYKDTKKYGGERTVHAIALIVKESLTLAHQRKLILDNPYTGIRLPTYRRKEIVPLTDEQCRNFLLAAAGLRDVRPTYTDGRGRVKRMPTIDARLFPLWASYLFLGERRGEGLGFLWENFNRDKRTVHITQQVQRVDEQGLLIRATKTEDSVRELPLPDRLFNSWCNHEDAVASQRGEGWTRIGLIFLSEENTPLWPDNIEARFRRIRAAAGLPDTVKLHHLRHTLATLADEVGCSEALKQDILGHAKKEMSHKYTHGRIDAMRKVLQAVEDRILDGVDFQKERESKNMDNDSHE